MEAKSKKRLPERKKRKSFFTFLNELKEELKKVSWTTKAELVSATKIVVISVFVFGIGIYIMDLAIKGCLETLKRLMSFIFG